MQCYRGLRLGQGFRSRNGAFPSRTPPMEPFQSRGQQLCKFIGTKETFNIRTEELNSHKTGSEQHHDHQCGSQAPDSEIVGTARFRKRDHENQMGGAPFSRITWSYFRASFTCASSPRLSESREQATNAADVS